MSDRVATALEIREKSGNLREKRKGKVREFIRFSEHISFTIS